MKLGNGFMACAFHFWNDGLNHIAASHRSCLGAGYPSRHIFGPFSGCNWAKKGGTAFLSANKSVPLPRSMGSQTANRCRQNDG